MRKTKHKIFFGDAKNVRDYEHPLQIGLRKYLAKLDEVWEVIRTLLLDFNIGNIYYSEPGEKL